MNESTRDALLALKREIHDKATYPSVQGVSPFISIKVFDAVLQNYLNSLK